MAAAVCVDDARSVHTKAEGVEATDFSRKLIGRWLNRAAYLGIFSTIALTYYSIQVTRDSAGSHDGSLALSELKGGLEFAHEKSGEFPQNMEDIPDAYDRDRIYRAELQSRIRDMRPRDAMRELDLANPLPSAYLWNPRRGDPQHFATLCVYFPVTALSRPPGLSLYSEYPWPEYVRAHNDIIVAFTKEATLPPERSLFEGRRRYVLMGNYHTITANDDELARMLERDREVRMDLGWPVFEWDPIRQEAARVRNVLDLPSKRVADH
ncbi:MAG TPA: hypothetical protein P5081_18050 [Phycisphaerae bacterium]|nr:hypothetical protein [Phycisphaerae bacterium]HRW54776.1 hypothetical protein [Phycisphaerae bacterium]